MIGRLAVVVVGLDQLTKWWMLRRLTLGESVPILPGLFHLTLVKNPGVAFGLFAPWGGAVVGIAVTLLLVLIAAARPLRRLAAPRPMPWAMGLILGGAVGNLLDRLRFGAVVDFLDFRVWPVFNVADSCITVGAVWIAWAWWRRR